jgi:hypothetical protein
MMCFQTFMAVGLPNMFKRAFSVNSSVVADAYTPMTKRLRAL